MEHCPNCGGESKIIAAILEALFRAHRIIAGEPYHY